LGWFLFEEDVDAHSRVFVEMACAKEWGYKWEEWQQLSYKEQMRYMYFETMKDIKNRAEIDRHKNGN
jgi:hypothetical protein